MQAVILAAGRGTRMQGLTDELPKPMLMVSGKTLLEHKFEALPAEVDEIIIIVGYQGEVIRATYGDAYHGVPIRYCVQETLDGTMGALALARPFLTGRFLVLMGDDIYGREDIEASLQVGDWAMLLEDMPEMSEGGRIVTDESGTVVAIEEGDHRGTPGLMNTNMFVLDIRVFDYPMVPKTAGSSEYGLPQTVLAASKASGIPLRAVSATGWIQITAPDDLTRAEATLK